MKYFLNFFSVIFIKNMDIKKSTKGILFPDIINEQHNKQKENKKTESDKALFLILEKIGKRNNRNKENL